MKYFILSLVAVAAVVVGCSTTTSTQTVAYQTIGTIQQSSKAAYDGYITAILNGVASTNGLPIVKNAYNQLEADEIAACVISQNSTNALASASLLQDAASLTAVITTATQLSK